MRRIREEDVPGSEYTITSPATPAFSIYRTYSEAGQAFENSNVPPTLVPSGTYYVVGDNRDNAMDSRYIGPIPASSVTGPVQYIYWSPRVSRIGSRVAAE